MLCRCVCQLECCLFDGVTCWAKIGGGVCLFMQAVAPSREYKFQTGLGKAVHGCTSCWFISTVFHTSGRVSRTYRGAAAFTLAESELPPANSSRSPRVSPMVPLIDYMQENDVAIRCPFNAARHTYDNKSPGWLWTRCSSGMVHLVVLFLRAISCPAFQLLSSKWVIKKNSHPKSSSSSFRLWSFLIDGDHTRECGKWSSLLSVWSSVKSQAHCLSSHTYTSLTLKMFIECLWEMFTMFFCFFFPLITLY